MWEDVLANSRLFHVHVLNLSRVYHIADLDCLSCVNCLEIKFSLVKDRDSPLVSDESANIQSRSCSARMKTAWELPSQPEHVWSRSLASLTLRGLKEDVVNDLHRSETGAFPISLPYLRYLEVHEDSSSDGSAILKLVECVDMPRLEKFVIHSTNHRPPPPDDIALNGRSSLKRLMTLAIFTSCEERLYDLLKLFTFTDASISDLHLDCSLSRSRSPSKVHKILEKDRLWDLSSFRIRSLTLVSNDPRTVDRLLEDLNCDMVENLSVHTPTSALHKTSNHCSRNHEIVTPFLSKLHIKNFTKSNAIELLERFVVKSLAVVEINLQVDAKSVCKRSGRPSTYITPKYSIWYIARMEITLQTHSLQDLRWILSSLPNISDLRLELWSSEHEILSPYRATGKICKIFRHSSSGLLCPALRSLEVKLWSNKAVSNIEKQKWKISLLCRDRSSTGLSPFVRKYFGVHRDLNEKHFSYIFVFCIEALHSLQSQILD